MAQEEGAIARMAKTKKLGLVPPGAPLTSPAPAAPAPIIEAPALSLAQGPFRNNRINFSAAPEIKPLNATTAMGAAPVPSGPSTSLGARPPLVGPPAPPPPINAPALGFSTGPFRDNRINFNAAPDPAPIKATTSLGAAPGKAVVPVDAGRSFLPPFATPAPRPNALIPVDAGRSFAPPYGQSLDPKTIYQPSNTSPVRGLAVIDGAGRELVPTGQPGRAMTPPTVSPAKPLPTQQLQLPAPASRQLSTVGEPVNQAPLANRGSSPYRPPPQLPPPAGMDAASLAEKAYGERVNPTPPRSNYVSPGVGGRDPFSPASTAAAQSAASPGASGQAQGILQKGLGTKQQWTDALDIKNTGRLVRGNGGAVSKLAGKALGVVGAVAKPLAAPISALQLGSALQDGRTSDAAWAAGDLAASGALFTPAAPAAGVYLGGRGIYEGSKMAGDAITSRMSGETLDAIGGTINQAIKSAGNVFGKKWGVNDDALMASNADESVRVQQAQAPAKAAEQAAAQPAKSQSASNPFADAAQAPATPAANPNTITAERQPNGVMSFSGGPNIGQDGGPISYVGSGAARMGKGFGVSTIQSGARPEQQGLEPAAERMTQPITLSSENSWQKRNDLRNLEVSASSFVNNQGYGGKRGLSPAQAAYNAALVQDIQARYGADAGTINANREFGNTQRTAMQEAGANQRESARLGVQRQELGIKAQGAQVDRARAEVQLRAAQQMEGIQRTLLDPNATPAQRKLAQSTLAALNGKTDSAKDRYITTKGGEEMNPDGMTKRTVPERIFDAETGQFLDQGAQQAQQKLPPGLVVGATTKQADGAYAVGNKTVTIKAGKVTEIK